MGVFDEVTCKFTLPWPEVQDATWQSKCTPAQYCERYEIRADGTLWHEAYDSRLEETDKAAMGFWIHRDNLRWVPVPFEGELEMHECVGHFWYSVRFWFRDGKVADAIYSKSEP